MPDLISHPSINFEPEDLGSIADVDDWRVAFVLATAKNLEINFTTEQREERGRKRDKNYARNIKINWKWFCNCDGNGESSMQDLSSINISLAFNT